MILSSIGRRLVRLFHQNLLVRRVPRRGAFRRAGAPRAAHVAERPAAFRELLGVPADKLDTFSNLKLRAITPAVDEINAIASFGCKIDPIKAGRKVDRVRVYWWRKDIDALKEAYAELNRPKVGRKARISGETEQVVDFPSLFDQETRELDT